MNQNSNMKAQQYVKDDVLARYLGLYPKQYQLVKNVAYQEGSITAELIPFIYPFTTEDLDYVTATQLHLYVSQLAYVLIGLSLEDEAYPVIRKLLPFETYETKMHAGRLFFTKLDQTMRRVIYKRNLPIKASMKVQDIRSVRGTRFCTVQFDLGQQATTGTILLSAQV